MEYVLELLKFDLSLRNTARDTYLMELLKSSQEQLQSYGIILDLQKSADAMFLSDWAAFAYRNRLEGEELPMNLRLRLNDRIVEKRSRYGSEDSG
ncbi:MAG: hypothetical protein LUE11_05390 [Clostridia bacterium]|nr:hypothetical protein [Clostridia bacterium]